MEIREERSSSMFMRVRGIRPKRETRRTARSQKVLEPTLRRGVSYEIIAAKMEDTSGCNFRETQKRFAHEYIECL